MFRGSGKTASVQCVQWDLRHREQRKPACRRVSPELRLHFQSERSVLPPFSQHPTLTLFTLYQHLVTMAGKIHRLRLELGKDQASRQVLKCFVKLGPYRETHIYLWIIYIYLEMEA